MEGKSIAVYLCGGIASYKVVSLVRMLIKNKAQVRVAMTKEAQKFIQPLTLATLTKHQVYTDLFAENNQDFVPHIDLADWSQAAIVAPATANIIAKRVWPTTLYPRPYWLVPVLSMLCQQ